MKNRFYLWALPLEGDRKPRVFLQTKSGEKYGRFSPDGRWVAYTSNESGRSEIYIRAFTDSAAGGVWQVSVEGGIFPAWRRKGAVPGRSSRPDDGGARRGEGEDAGAWRADFSIPGANLWRRAGREHGRGAIRRRSGRTLPDQHGERQRCNCHHAPAKLETKVTVNP